MNPNECYHSGDAGGLNLCGFDSFLHLMARDRLQHHLLPRFMPSAIELRNQLPSMLIAYKACFPKWDPKFMESTIEETLTTGMLSTDSLDLMCWFYDFPVYVHFMADGQLVRYARRGRDSSPPISDRTCLLFYEGHCYYGKSGIQNHTHEALMGFSQLEAKTPPSKIKHVVGVFVCRKKDGFLLWKGKASTKWGLPGGSVPDATHSYEQLLFEYTKALTGFQPMGSDRNCLLARTNKAGTTICLHYVSINVGFNSSIFSQRTKVNEVKAFTFATINPKDHSVCSNLKQTLAVVPGHYESATSPSVLAFMVPPVPELPTEDTEVVVVTPNGTIVPTVWEQNVIATREQAAVSQDSASPLVLGPQPNSLLNPTKIESKVEPPVDEPVSAPIPEVEQTEPPLFKEGDQRGYIPPLENQMWEVINAAKKAHPKIVGVLSASDYLTMVKNGVRENLFDSAPLCGLEEFMLAIVNNHGGGSPPPSGREDRLHQLVGDAILSEDAKSYFYAINRTPFSSGSDTEYHSEQEHLPSRPDVENDSSTAYHSDSDHSVYSLKPKSREDYDSDTRWKSSRKSYSVYQPQSHSGCETPDDVKRMKRAYVINQQLRNPKFHEILGKARPIPLPIAKDETPAEWLATAKETVFGYLEVQVKKTFEDLKKQNSWVNDTVDVALGFAAVLYPITNIIMELLDGRWTWYSITLHVAAMGFAIFHQLSTLVKIVTTKEYAVKAATLAVQTVLGISIEQRVPEGYTEKSGISVHTAIPGLALSTLLTAFSIGGQKGNMSAAATGFNFGQKITEVAERIALAVAYYFKWDIDGKMNVTQAALDFQTQLDEIEQQDVPAVTQNFAAYSALSTEIKQFIVTTKGLVDSVTMGLVSAKLTKLDATLNLVRKTWTSRQKRPAPAAFYFWSDQGGIGKTDAVPYFAKCVAAKIAGVNSNIMGMQSKEHTPAYTGESSLFYDEIGAELSPTKNPFAQLNNILSGNAISQPAANLESKEQILKPLVVYLCSNVSIREQNTGLKGAADAAFKTRLNVYEVVDAKFDKNAGRYNQAHRKADFSHLQFRGVDGKSHSTKEMVNIICGRIAVNVANYREQANGGPVDNTPFATSDGVLDVTDLYTEKAADETKFVITVVGKPGVGKSKHFLPLLKASLAGPEARVLIPTSLDALKELSLSTAMTETIVVIDDLINFHIVKHQQALLDLYNYSTGAVKFILLTNYAPARRSWLWGDRTEVDFEPVTLIEGLARRLGFTENVYSQAVTMDEQLAVKSYHSQNPITVEQIVKKYMVHRSNSAFGISLKTMPDALGFSRVEADAWLELEEVPTVPEFFSALVRSGGVSVRCLTLIGKLAAIDYTSLSLDNAVTQVMVRLLAHFRDLKVFVRVGINKWYVNGIHYFTGAHEDNFMFVSDDERGNVCYKVVEVTGIDTDYSMYLNQEIVDCIRQGIMPSPAVLARADFNHRIWVYLGVQHLNQTLVWDAISEAFPANWKIYLKLSMAKVKSRVSGVIDWLKKSPWMAGFFFVTASLLTHLASKYIWKLIKSKMSKPHDYTIYVTGDRPCPTCVDGYQSPACPNSNVYTSLGRTQRKYRSITINGKTQMVSGDEDKTTPDESDFIHEIQRKMKESGNPTMLMGDFGGRQGTVTRVRDDDGYYDLHFEEDNYMQKSAGYDEHHVRLVCNNTGAELWGILVNDNIVRFPSHLCHDHSALITIKGTAYTLKIVKSFKGQDASYGVVHKEGKKAKFPGIRDITGKFLSHTQLLNVQEGVCMRPPPSRNVNPVSLRFCSNLTRPLIGKNSLVGTDKNVFFATRAAVSYSGYSPGDCGCLLMTKYENNNKIIGQLIGSNEYGSSSTDVFSAPTIEEWNLFCDSQASFSTKGATTDYTSVGYMRQDGLGEVLIPGSLVDKLELSLKTDWDDPATAFSLVGTYHNRLPYDQATSSKPLLGHAFGPVLGNLKKPALSVVEIESKHKDKMRPDPEGNYFAPSVRLIKSQPGCFRPSIPHAAQLREIGEELGSYYRMEAGHPDISPLSIEDAIWGNRRVPPMARDTSTGAVYQLLYPGVSQKAYLWTVDRGVYDGRTPFEVMAKEQWDSWKTDVPILYPQAVSMKAENLVPEKDFKKRLVFVVDPHTSVNQRRVFFPIQVAFAAMGFLSPFLLAYDPILHTHQFVKALKRGKKRFLSLDVSAFDLTVPQEVVDAAVEFMVCFTKAGTVYAKLIRNAMYAASGMAALIDRGLYSRHGGIASGITCTSLVDGVCMLIVSAYCWHSIHDIHCDVPLYKLHEDSRHTGDDTTLASSGKFPTEASDYVRVAKRDLGMTFTACANKDGLPEFGETVYSINHCSRQVIDLPGSPGVYTGKLKPEAVSSAMCWTKSSDVREIWTQLENCQKELALYPQSVYEEFQRITVNKAPRVERIRLCDVLLEIKEGILNASFDKSLAPNSSEIFSVPIRDIPKIRKLCFASEKLKTNISQFEKPDSIDLLWLTETTAKMNTTSHLERVSLLEPAAIVFMVPIPGSSQFMTEYLNTIENGVLPDWVVHFKDFPLFIPGSRRQRQLHKWVVMAGAYALRIQHRNYAQILVDIDIWASAQGSKFVQLSAAPKTMTAAPPVVSPDGHACAMGSSVDAPVGALPTTLSPSAVVGMDPLYPTIGAAMAPELMMQSGGIRGLLNYQVDSDLNLLTCANMKIYKEIFVINMGTDEGVAVKIYNVNPWNPEILNDATMIWANEHDRFIAGPNGGFNMSVQVVSAATVIGNVKVAYIPALYEHMVITQANIDVFKPLEFACNVSGEGNIVIVPSGGEFAMTSCYRHGQTKHFGRLAFVTSTKFENSYDATIGVQVKVSTSLREGSGYYTPSYLRRPSVLPTLGDSWDLPVAANVVCIDGRHQDPVIPEFSAVADVVYTYPPPDGTLTLSGLPLVPIPALTTKTCLYGTATGAVATGNATKGMAADNILAEQAGNFTKVQVAKNTAKIKVYTPSAAMATEWNRLQAKSVIQMKGLSIDMENAKLGTDLGSNKTETDIETLAMKKVVFGKEVVYYRVDPTRRVSYADASVFLDSTDILTYEVNASEADEGDEFYALNGGGAAIAGKITGAPFCSQAPTDTEKAPLGLLTVRLSPKPAPLPAVPSTVGQGRTIPFYAVQDEQNVKVAKFLKEGDYFGIVTTLKSAAGVLLGDILRTAEGMFVSEIGITEFGVLNLAEPIQTHKPITSRTELVSIQAAFSTRITKDRLYMASYRNQTTWDKMSKADLLGQYTQKSFNSMQGSARSYMREPEGMPSLFPFVMSNNDDKENGGKPAEKKKKGTGVSLNSARQRLADRIAPSRSGPSTSNASTGTVGMRTASTNTNTIGVRSFSQNTPITGEPMAQVRTMLPSKSVTDQFPSLPNQGNGIVFQPASSQTPWPSRGNGTYGNFRPGFQAESGPAPWPSMEQDDALLQDAEFIAMAATARTISQHVTIYEVGVEEELYMQYNTIDGEFPPDHFCLAEIPESKLLHYFDQEGASYQQLGQSLGSGITAGIGAITSATNNNRTNANNKQMLAMQLKSQAMLQNSNAQLTQTNRTLQAVPGIGQIR